MPRKRKKGMHRTPDQSYDAQRRSAGRAQDLGQRFEARVAKSLKNRKAEKAGRKSARMKK